MIPSADSPRPAPTPGELARRQVEAAGGADRRVDRSAGRDRREQGSGRWKGEAFESYLDGTSNESQPPDESTPNGTAEKEPPIDPDDPRGTILDTTA